MKSAIYLIICHNVSIESAIQSDYSLINLAICSSYVYYIPNTSAIYNDYSLTDSATALCYVPQEDPIGCKSAQSSRKDAKPKTMPKTCHLCYHIVFTVMPFVLYDICRTEDHKPQRRASKISTISTCSFLYVMFYCPLTLKSL
jgi:hypothetical protein